MKVTYVPIIVLALIGCDGGSRNNETDSNDAPAVTKKSKTRSTPSPSTVSEVWRRWGRLDSRLTSLDRASLDRLLNQITDQRYSDEKGAEFEIAIGELASRDPEAALAYFIPQKMRPTEPGFAFVASLLAETAPDLLKDWLQNELKSAPLGVRAECRRIGLQGLAAVNPQSALDFFNQGEWDQAGKSDAINSLFLSWARKSTTIALEAAEKSFTGEDLDRALYNIILVAKTKDPEAALEMAVKIGDSSSRGVATGSIFSSWMDSDPHAALERLKTISGPDLQTVLMSDLSGGVERSVVGKLVINSPDQFISLLQTIVPSSANEDLFKSAVLALSPTSPDKVVDLLDSLPEGSLKKSLIGVQFSALAREHPGSVAGQIGMITDEAAKIEAYRAIGRISNANNYESVLASCGEVTDEQRREFIAAAIPGISMSDPKAAADMLIRNGIFINGEESGRLLTTVAMKLASSDLTYAEKWLNDLPEDQQPLVMKGIAEEMARTDIKKLSERLAGAPRNKNWEAGVKVLISNLQSSDPVMAKSWQESLDAQKIK
jgi:hypothetical protein